MLTQETRVDIHVLHRQVVHFAFMGEEGMVHRLLEAGADVNKLSENYESALLASVRMMDATDPATDPSHDSMFQALIKFPHNQKVLNVRTAKKRLSLLIAGVETGRVDVVEALLKLGCEPDFRGGVDLITPLHFCIQRIATLKDPSSIENILDETPDDSVSLDAIRRYIGAPTGMTLPEVKRWLEKQAANPSFKQIRKAVGKILFNATIKGLDLLVLQDMAMLLINRGADPNAEHAHPIKGYTPVMMAVEADEAEIVKALVAAGGSMDKTYLDPHSGSRVNCYAIARYFEARSVLELVE
jgi:ankyrin repeat protein